ncbi:hypothetical protein DFH28DRAFT_1125375 [Melampsora americana]|nr:hypothetical protein DFH28DRAFT_1125375 [Melampsora americana]
MRLTYQNLLSHTELHSNANIISHPIQDYLNSQQALRSNQDHSKIQNQSKVNEHIKTITQNKQNQINPHHESKTKKPSAYTIHNWSSSDSISLKARVPNSNQSLIINNPTENKQNQTNQKIKPPQKRQKIKVRIETSKPKHKRKREEEEMRIEENQNSIINRKKILNQRNESRRKKASLIQDQSIPIHSKLKQNLQSKLDSDMINPRKNSNHNLNIAFNGIESIPKSNSIKHQGRITIERSHHFGLFQRKVSSSKVKPVPRKGSGDLIFNELKFLDKQKHIRSNEKSQSPAMEVRSNKNLDKAHDQMDDSDSDEVNSQRNVKTKRIRKDVTLNSSIQEACDQNEISQSISSHSDSNNLHSANSLRLRHSGRLSSCASISLKLNSTQQSENKYDEHQQPNLVSSQNDSKSQEPQEASRHGETSIEETFVPSRRPTGRDSRFRSTPELPLRSDPVEKMSYSPKTNNSLDRLIMACETDMPMIYDRIAPNLPYQSHDSHYPASSSFENDEVVNASRLPRTSSLQNHQEILDGDDVYSIATELAEDPYLEDQVEDDYEEEYLYYPEVEDEFGVDAYDSRPNPYAHDPFESGDDRRRRYSISKAQALEDLGDPQEDELYSPVVEEEMKVDAYGFGLGHYAQEPDQLEFVDHLNQESSRAKRQTLENFDFTLMHSKIQDRNQDESLSKMNGLIKPNESNQTHLYFDFRLNGLPIKCSEMKERGLKWEKEEMRLGEKIGLMDEESRKGSLVDQVNLRSQIDVTPPGFEWIPCRA